MDTCLASFFTRPESQPATHGGAIHLLSEQKQKVANNNNTTVGTNCYVRNVVHLVRSTSSRQPRSEPPQQQTRQHRSVNSPTSPLLRKQSHLASQLPRWGYLYPEVNRRSCSALRKSPSGSPRALRIGPPAQPPSWP